MKQKNCTTSLRREKYPLSWWKILSTAGRPITADHAAFLLRIACWFCSVTQKINTHVLCGAGNLRGVSPACLSTFVSALLCVLFLAHGAIETPCTAALFITQDEEEPKPVSQTTRPHHRSVPSILRKPRSTVAGELN